MHVAYQGHSTLTMSLCLVNRQGSLHLAASVVSQFDSAAGLASIAYAPSSCHYATDLSPLVQAGHGTF